MFWDVFLIMELFIVLFEISRYHLVTLVFNKWMACAPIILKTQLCWKGKAYSLRLTSPYRIPEFVILLSLYSLLTQSPRNELLLLYSVAVINVKSFDLFKIIFQLLYGTDIYMCYILKTPVHCNGKLKRDLLY